MLLGLAIQAATLAFATEPSLITRAIGYVSGAALVYGGAQWARGRGYTPWIGFLSLLSFLGVGILLMLPTEPRGKRLFGIFAAKPEKIDVRGQDADAAA